MERKSAMTSVQRNHYVAILTYLERLLANAVVRSSSVVIGFHVLLLSGHSLAVLKSVLSMVAEGAVTAHSDRGEDTCATRDLSTMRGA